MNTTLLILTFIAIFLSGWWVAGKIAGKNPD
jgi:hypothetical protein